MTKIILAVLVPLIALNVFAKETKGARKPDAAAVTKELLAKKFHELAELMSQGRAAGDTCELNIYEGDVLDAYRRAKEMDPSIRASATLQNDLKANLGFKLLEAGINVTALKDGNPETMVGSNFWGTTGGIYPFTLELLEGGKARYDYYVVDNEGVDLKPVQAMGTWTFRAASSNKHPNPLLIVTLPTAAGGKNKTKSYVVAQDDSGLSLYPSHSYKPYGQENFPAFSATHYECE